MEIDEQALLETFAKNFLLKTRRERSLFELKSTTKRHLFINKFNHKWASQLDMRKIFQLQNNPDDFSFVINYLKIKDSELCYVISTYDEIHNKTLSFKQAFSECYGRGFATIILTKNADKLYLETELTFGKQNRFVGKILERNSLT